MALTKVPSNLDAAVSITQSASDNSTNVATTAYVDTAIANLVDGAPAALNTLDEIAAALNDDAALNTTLTTSIATKLPLAGGTLTGALTINSGTANTGLTITSTDAASWLTMTDPTASLFFGNTGGEFALWTGGSEAMRVDGSGNVGIGTTTPDTNLEVNILAGGDGNGIHITSTSTTNDPALQLSRNSGAADSFRITPRGAPGSAYLAIARENSLATGISLSHDDKVGIGTTAPAHKLHVHATSGSEPLGLFQTTSAGDCAVRIEGIGGEAYLEIANTSASSGNTSNSWGIGCNDDTNLHIAYGTNGTMNKNSSVPQFYINSSTGNVGIGTANPTSNLDVNSTAYVNTDSTQAFRFTYNGSPRAMISAYGGEGELSLYRSSNAKNIYISSYYDSYFNGGNVGIGTDTPTDTYNYGKVLDIHGSTGAVTYLRDSDATSNFGFLAYDGGTTNRCVIGGGGSAYLRFISAGNETMSITANGALHIDNTMNYGGKSWLNEAVGGSTPVGGANASGNTYQKLRLWVNGDINVNQGRGLHFGDVTDSAPLCIREGSPSEHGTDRDRLEIWGRKQLTLISSYGAISPGDSSSAGAGRSSSFYIKKNGQMGGTWTEVITTPNGGDQTCRVFEDWTGRWIMVGRFAADARASIQSTWSSVSGLNTAASQSTATAFSSDWGDIYPSEVRIMGCTDVEEYMDTRTIDFVYGNKPSGVHSYTPRQWKHFFAGGTSDGMTANAGGSPRFGFTVGYAYDGKGRWYNPNMHGMGMSDANTTNPIAAYSTATSNAFNWHTAQDAKLLATHYRTFASQDVYQTTGFGADDSVQGFYDSYPTEYTNMGGGTTGGGVHAAFTSAVFVLIKLHY
jgi:hypothetical protein